MRVISFGIYSKAPEYPRHRNLIRGLIERGIDVVECHCSMAATFDERMRAVRSLSGAARYVLNLAASYASLSWQYLRAPRAEVILIGYPGYFHVPLARVLRRYPGWREGDQCNRPARETTAEPARSGNQSLGVAFQFSFSRRDN